jgi:beta-N-acetylhexosaminidase
MHGKHGPADMVALHEDAAFMQAIHQVGDVGKSNGNLAFTA